MIFDTLTVADLLARVEKLRAELLDLHGRFVNCRPTDRVRVLLLEVPAKARHNVRRTVAVVVGQEEAAAAINAAINALESNGDDGRALALVHLRSVRDALTMQ